MGPYNSTFSVWIPSPFCSHGKLFDQISSLQTTISCYKFGILLNEGVVEGKIDAELLMYDVSLCRRELSNVQINVAQDFLTERDEHFCLY